MLFLLMLGMKFSLGLVYALHEIEPSSVLPHQKRTTYFTYDAFVVTISTRHIATGSISYFVRYSECLNHDGRVACLDKQILAADVSNKEQL